METFTVGARLAQVKKRRGDDVYGIGEQALLNYLDDCRKREGRAPLTIQEQNLAIEQAKAIGQLPQD